MRQALFCADSETELRIDLSFEIRILDFSQSHPNSHFPNFAYILNIKFKKQLNIFLKKIKFIKKIKNTVLFRIQFSISLYIFY
jgi:hypothetical protein